MEEFIDKLKSFKPAHAFFIGVDSDGTAFDSMEIKHKEVFIPIAIEIWNLGRIENEFRQAEEFVNLYSVHRGINRFPGLLMTFELLQEKLGHNLGELGIPDLQDFKDFCNSGLSMSNSSLEKFMTNRKSNFLKQLWDWSTLCDVHFLKLTESLPPFEYVATALDCASQYADIMVISAASAKGLSKDWCKAGLTGYISLVAGQEAGSKKEQLEYVVTGKYEKNHVLMIGDAPGDLQAAKENNALFYPILPGKEVESWKKFYEESLEKFISVNYAGTYEDKLIEEFVDLLQEKQY